MLPLPINEIFGFCFITPSTNIKYAYYYITNRFKKKEFLNYIVNWLIHKN
ncbi:hypothetical protein RPATATE_1115 [Rickettsia parkeri str. Tate's Hell]|uniref:Uncharacterized protein n=2 Tax=spotted fever group TaxID=114277 RepID=A0A0F3N1Q0_RICAM|nr:hypothetical protein APHACPA_1018 [Rickettsia amblyommatis str. Ac/Pa]KJV95037.1 hypothetical protein RAMDARK_0727 [Rickettsia amblyommatis str. Darkwater]KJV95432.1 hypothetical protein RPAAT24_1409 [Rickettsia parkeri str. AT\